MSLPDGYGYIYPSAGGLFTCLACGVVVHNTQSHDGWHRGMRDFIMQSTDQRPLKSSQQYRNGGR